MKTTAVVAALLASVAMAQPHHGRHAHQKKDINKRLYETEWTTETTWATLYIDEHGTTLQEPSPAQFYPSTTSEETTSTMSSSASLSTSESTTTPEPIPSSTPTPPEPTTSTEAAAKEDDPTTTIQAPVYTPTTAEASEPTSGSDSGSGSSVGGSSYTGEMTFYDPAGYGACGTNLLGMKPSGTSPSDPAIVALATTRFITDATGGNSNNDPVCGKMIKFTIDGKTGYGRVDDKCQACAYNDIDINPEAFSGLRSLGDGRVIVKWEFL